MILHGREGRIGGRGSTNSVYLNGDVRCQMESNWGDIFLADRRYIKAQRNSEYVNRQWIYKRPGNARRRELSTIGEDNEAELSLLHDLHLHCSTTLKNDLSFLTPICHFSPFFKINSLMSTPYWAAYMRCPYIYSRQRQAMHHTSRGSTRLPTIGFLTNDRVCELHMEMWHIWAI